MGHRKVFVGVIVALVLYVANAVLWLADPRTWLPPRQRVIRGVCVETWGHKVVNNSWGYREREVTPRRPGVTRVLVLDDSLTWGTGMDVKARWPDLLGFILGPEYEVYCFACSGDSTDMESRRARKLIPVVKPDVVIVGFCCNDPQRRGEDWSQEKADFEGIYGRTMAVIDKGSRCVLLWHVWERVNKAIRAMAYPSPLDALDRCYNQDSVDWRLWQLSLADIKRCGKPCIFASLINFRYANPRVLGWHRQAEAEARRQGWTVVTFDQASALQGVPWRKLMINRADGHPSVFLESIYASGVLHALMRAESGTVVE
jgi:hypothetical protein